RHQSVSDGIRHTLPHTRGSDPWRRGNDVSGIHAEAAACTAMKRFARSMLAVLFALLLGGVSWGRQNRTGAGNEIHILPVQGNVYMLVGPGGNTTVQAGDDGVLLVDTKTAELSANLLAAISQLSKKPIHYIVNTNADPDHTGGNETL